MRSIPGRHRRHADALRWYLFTASPPGSPRLSALVGESLRKFMLYALEHVCLLCDHEPGRTASERRLTYTTIATTIRRLLGATA